MKLSPTVLVLLALSSCVGCVASLRSAVPVRSIQEQRGSTVSILMLCSKDATTGEPRASMGSGVVVSPNEVLTAAHVVDGCGVRPNISAAEPGDFSHNMKIVLDAPSADLARLQIVDQSSFHAAPRVGISSVEPRDAVCIVSGIPTIDYRCGVVEQKTSAAKQNLDLSILVEPGNSGGPVYDRRGRLVGIVTNYRTLARGHQISGGRATELHGKSWVLRDFSLVLP